MLFYCFSLVSRFAALSCAILLCLLSLCLGRDVEHLMRFVYSTLNQLVRFVIQNVLEFYFDSVRMVTFKTIHPQRFVCECLCFSLHLFMEINQLLIETKRRRKKNNVKKTNTNEMHERNKKLIIIYDIENDL